MGKIADKRPSDIKDSTFLSGTYSMTGTCRFCRQMKTMQFITDKVSQEEVDAAVTQSCNCPEARDYDQIQEAAEKAKTNLRTLNKQMGTGFTEEVEGMCDKAIDCIKDGHIGRISIKTDTRSISIKKKGDRKINVLISKNTRWDIDS